MPTYYTTTATNNTYRTNNWYYYIPTSTTTWTIDCSGFYSKTMPAKEKRINVSEDDMLNLLQGDED